MDRSHAVSCRLLDTPQTSAFRYGSLRGLFYPLLRRLLQERTRKQLRIRPRLE